MTSRRLHVALHPEQIEGVPYIPIWGLWARLPSQEVFVRWVWQATRAPATQ